MNEIKEEFRILWVLIKAEWLGKRQSSFWGMVLSLLNPLMTFVIAYFVYSKMGRGIVDNYWLSICVGILHWNIFSSVTNNCVGCYKAHGDVLSGFVLWPISPLLAHFFASVIRSFFEVVLFIVIIAIFIGISWKTFFVYLSIMLLFYLLSFFVSLLISLTRVFFQDVEYVWPLVLRILFIASPILYDPMIVDEKYHAVLEINPLYHILLMLKGCFQGSVYSSYYNVSYVIVFIGVIVAATSLLYCKLRFKLVERL